MRLDLALEATERTIEARRTDAWQGLCDRIDADCHPEQRLFASDPGRRIVALVGRGGGKTTGGRARLVKRMLRTARAKCVYIATTKDHAQRLMWEPLKQLFAELGFVAGIDVVYNETKLSVRLVRNGAQLWLFGADKPKEIEKLRGLPFHEVHIDEAASYPVGLLEHLVTQIVGPRLGDFGGCICIYGTPGNVLRGMFYEITRTGSKLHRPYVDRDAPEHAGARGFSSHAWTLASAIAATAARPIQALVNLWAEALLEKATNGWSDDNPIWLREYMGKWAADDTINVFRYRAHLVGDAARDAGKPDGIEWNQWDPPRVGPLQFAKLPDEFREWVHIIAMDLGSSDPTAINVLAFAPADITRTVYHRYGFERTKLYIKELAFLLIGEELKHEDPSGIIGAIGEWPNGMVADAAHLGGNILDELANVYGIRVEMAVKGYKYKVGAIEVINGDLIDGRLKVLKGSRLEAELLELQWAQDKYENWIERKDQPNHNTDTLIYGRALLSALISAGAVTLGPAETTLDPRAAGYVPPPPPGAIPRDEGDYSHLFDADYDALLG